MDKKIASNVLHKDSYSLKIKKGLEKKCSVLLNSILKSKLVLYINSFIIGGNELGMEPAISQKGRSFFPSGFFSCLWILKTDKEIQGGSRAGEIHNNL